MIKSIKVDFEPPSLPAENEELAVYVEYAERLDSFRAEYYESIQTIFLKKQGHLAFLKGQALLRAKASSKVDVDWDEIFTAFGVKRSTGFVHIDIAENFSEEETKGIGVNELREQAQRRRAAAGGQGEEREGDPPDVGPDIPSHMYSIKKARADLKEAKRRLKRFEDDIDNTADAINNPLATPSDLSSFDTEFGELKSLLDRADEARSKVLADLTAENNKLILEGSAVRIAETDGEEAA